MNPDAITYRETARPTTRIAMASDMDDVGLADKRPILAWNSFVCSVCLRPAYVPVEQLDATIIDSLESETFHSPGVTTTDEVAWISEVVILRLCPAFRHDLEDIHVGHFTGPTTFQPSRERTGTRRNARGRGNDPNRITAYKTVVHQGCFDEMVKKLKVFDVRAVRSLVRRLEMLQREEKSDTHEEEMDEAEMQKAMLLAREFGMMLRERTEKAETCGARVLQHDLISPFKSLQFPTFPTPSPKLGTLTLGTPSVLPTELLNSIALLVLSDSKDQSATDFLNLRSASRGWMHFPYTQAVWRRACEELFGWANLGEQAASGLLPAEARGNVDWKKVYMACMQAPGMRGARRVAMKVEEVVKWVERRTGCETPQE